MSLKKKMTEITVKCCDICGKEITCKEFSPEMNGLAIVLKDKPTDDVVLDICEECANKYINIIKGELRAKLVEVIKKLEKSNGK